MIVFVSGRSLLLGPRCTYRSKRSSVKTLKDQCVVTTTHGPQVIENPRMNKHAETIITRLYHSETLL